MSYRCCDDHRAEAVRRHRMRAPGAYLNGIEWLEVIDADAILPADRQRLLRLQFINPLLGSITPANIRIEGGERIRGIRAETVTAISPQLVEIRLSEWGDFSRYTLRLVEPSLLGLPDFGSVLSGFDPHLAACDFTFKVDCPSDFDCSKTPACPEEPVEEIGIDYLAKDYEGFRRLMLDRITALNPDWRERHAADMGVALVELLAYAGDSLSYQQDAIATEAYLGTARRRVSVRRHARLVDYRMDEGASPRVWMHLEVAPFQGPVVLPATPTLETRARTLFDEDTEPGKRPIRFLTGADNQYRNAGVLYPGSPEEQALLAERVEVFELAEPDPVTLYEEHNELFFYTWGASDCCLPTGSTSATLVGAYPHLRKGDVLILREKAGPETGNIADADPRRRHAIRLSVDPVITSDPLFEILAEIDVGSGASGFGSGYDGSGYMSGSGGSGIGSGYGSSGYTSGSGGSGSSGSDSGAPFQITMIAWDVADALPFPLCISATIDGVEHTDLASALGNIVLADGGMTVTGLNDLGEVKASPLSRVLAGGRDRCAEESDEERERRFVPTRYRPSLAETPLVWTTATTIRRANVEVRVPYDRNQPASKAVTTDGDSFPAIVLIETTTGDFWTPERDLLDSRGDAREFTVEVEDDGRASLRFGDDRLGKRPDAGNAFVALYRVSGRALNVGSGAIRYMVGAVIGIESVTNPMPARGGRLPESIEEVRQRAPMAFRTNQRAVTLADYATIAQRHPEVQRAVATFQWTGSWRTVFLTVDRVSGREVDEAFREDIREFLESYRMAGHDVEVTEPVYVPLELEIFVCVRPEYFRSDVKVALLDIFSNRLLPDGRRGLFHPDELTFNQSIYLSRLYAAAQAVPGVESVEVTTFQRQGIASKAALQSGELTFGALEIPRLDNDPSFPDRGVFRPVMGGGK